MRSDGFFTLATMKIQSQSNRQLRAVRRSNGILLFLARTDCNPLLSTAVEKLTETTRGNLVYCECVVSFYFFCKALGMSPGRNRVVQEEPLQWSHEFSFILSIWSAELISIDDETSLRKHIENSIVEWPHTTVAYIADFCHVLDALESYTCALAKS